MIVAGVLGGMTLPGTAEVVRLRGSVVVERGAEVRLGELATVSGGGVAGERLADVVILSGVQGPVKVKAEAILMAVISQQGAAATNDLEMSGAATCEVKIAGAGAPAAPASMGAGAGAPAAVEKSGAAAKVKSASPPASPIAAAATAAGPCLVDMIRSRVVKELGASAEDVQVDVETINPLVAEPLPAGRNWLIRPLTRTFLGSIQFEAQLVEGEKSLQRLTVSADVQRRVKVIVSTQPLARGDVVQATAVEEREVLLDRDMPTLFNTAGDVVGLEAKVPIAAGTRLDQRDFKACEMAERGDAITVVFVSAALRVKSPAKALDGGKLHSMIKVLNEKDNEQYQAELIGKRLAVVGGPLSADEEAKLREVAQ
ncbi:MAG TPA: flagellar basal body P-ring formation chaperone FlgA [Phycisphaerae bacterium]|nr:flagellar basal body P-ring formation chaperone FlgA [Phycisphaerae bacterium]